MPKFRNPPGGVGGVGVTVRVTEETDNSSVTQTRAGFLELVSWFDSEEAALMAKRSLNTFSEKQEEAEAVVVVVWTGDHRRSSRNRGKGEKERDRRRRQPTAI